MDEIDRKLVALLRTDARTPVASLAKTLKVSRGTVQNRIDRMMARGEILGFTLKMGPEAEAGRVRAIMAIAVEGERSGGVLEALRAFPEVEAVHMTYGRWEYLADRYIEHMGDFSRRLEL